MKPDILKQTHSEHINTQVMHDLVSLGGPEMVDRLIDLYFNNGLKDYEKILAFAKVNNLAEVALAAHSLISSSGNLGGIHVSKLSKEIESVALAHELDELSRLLPEFEAAHQHFFGYLSQLRGNP